MVASAARASARFELQPTLEDVVRVCGALRPLMPARLPEEDRYAIEIAMTEALTNLVEHGYEGRPDAAPARIKWLETDDLLLVEVRDEGRPIPRDVLARAGPDTFGYDPTDIGSLPESGMGLALMKAAFDDLDYRSENGTNVLTLRKRICPA